MQIIQRSQVQTRLHVHAANDFVPLKIDQASTVAATMIIHLISEICVFKSRLRTVVGCMTILKDCLPKVIFIPAFLRDELLFTKVNLPHNKENQQPL